jgi:hypothetical protein
MTVVIISGLVNCRKNISYLHEDLYRQTMLFKAAHRTAEFATTNVQKQQKM